MSLAHSATPACSKYLLTHLPNDVLLRSLHAVVARDRSTTAEVLAHIAEVDRRRLYRPAGYPSMRTYCLGELHLSEDAASKRIQAARVARDFPAIFGALAEGRLHLSAVGLLAPKLKQGTTQEIADELIAAATHKSKSEIEVILAQRFPQPDVPTRVEAVPPTSSLISFTEQHAPGHVENELAPGRTEPPAPRPRVKPLAPERFSLQVTISQRTHDTLRDVQALLSHKIPSGDIAEVLDLALNELKKKLEKRKFAATDRPRHGRKRSTAQGRHIPAHVRRAVRERDGDQCTFVSDIGHRCESRKCLEYDHIDEFARGGEATVEGIRLLCRAHNQYTAEQTYGAEFMSRKREEAQQAARAKREAAEARAKADAAKARAAAEAEQARAVANAQAEADVERARELDVVPWLRRLGFRMDEARQAAKLCEAIPNAPLEERVRRALSFFKPRRTITVPAATQ